MDGDLDKAIPFGPTFHPTEAEFRDFKTYVYKISSLPEIKKCGCAKVG